MVVLLNCAVRPFACAVLIPSCCCPLPHVCAGAVRTVVRMTSVTKPTDPDVVEALARRGIKDPGSDAVIQMTRLRQQRALDVDKQKRSVSGISGGVLHKHLRLTDIEREIKILEEGVEEYQNMIELHEKEKVFIKKMQEDDSQWCATFDRVIGPFQEKYDQCQRDVIKLAESGKAVYQKSFQKVLERNHTHTRSPKICLSGWCPRKHRYSP